MMEIRSDTATGAVLRERCTVAICKSCASLDEQFLKSTTRNMDGSLLKNKVDM